jgi:5'-methylthioadenosine phosphorylase
VVIPDQVFDFTRFRDRTFFGNGIVAHIGSAQPFCPHLMDMAFHAVQKFSHQVHLGGTAITIEGPRFSTKAESNLFRSWGMSIIGMTTSPEVFLAREAELCYAAIAHVTDYDVWHQSEDPVTVEMVIRTLNENVEVIQNAIVHLVETLPEEWDDDCLHAVDKAIMTNPNQIPAETREKLDLLIGKYLPR